MKRIYAGYLAAAALLIVGLVLVVLWWHFTIVHLSQETGTSDESSRSYAFWSGIGGLVTIAGSAVTFVVTYYRHHNCHDRHCWRIGHFPMTDTNGVAYRACRIHNPLVPHEHARHSLFRHHFTAEHMDAVRARILAAQPQPRKDPPR